MHYGCALPQTREYTSRREIRLVPLQPTWFAQIPALLETLQAETAPPECKRKDIERFFGVRRRRAIGLLHRFGASRRGSELVTPRESVTAFLEQRWSDEAAAHAAAQERQVAEALTEARRALTLPRIPLPSPAQLSAITFAGLPVGIHLTRTEVSVTFSSAQDLLAKLFALAQALANDYESLEEALTDRHPKEELGHGLPF